MGAVRGHRLITFIYSLNKLDAICCIRNEPCFRTRAYCRLIQPPTPGKKLYKLHELGLKKTFFISPGFVNLWILLTGTLVIILAPCSKIALIVLQHVMKCYATTEVK